MYYIKVIGKGVKRSVAHIWLGEDTACTMSSTGGLNNATYAVVDSTNGKSICQHCISVTTSK